MYQQCLQVSIPLFGDRAQAVLAATRMLSGDQSQRGGVIAPTLEYMRIAHARHQRRGRLRCDRRDLHEPPRRFARLGKRADLGVILCDVLIEGVELRQ